MKQSGKDKFSFDHQKLQLGVLCSIFLHYVTKIKVLGFERRNSQQQRASSNEELIFSYRWKCMGIKQEINYCMYNSSGQTSFLFLFISIFVGTKKKWCDKIIQTTVSINGAPIHCSQPIRDKNEKRNYFQFICKSY